MTFVLDDIADYLASGGVGTVGTSIFKGGMFDGGTAATPDAQVAVYEYLGPAPQQVFGSGVASPTVSPRVQVVCRDVKYSDARTKAQAVYARLAPVTDVTINSTRYLRIEALGEPSFIGSDQNGRPLIGCNYGVLREQ